MESELLTYCRARLKARKQSRKAIAEAVGVSLSFVKYLETGKPSIKNPGIDRVERLARYLRECEAA